MTYSIEFSNPAAKQFKSLPFQNQMQLKIKVDALSTNPRPVGIVKLISEENPYRLRVGDYRIIYTIEDKKLVVLSDIAVKSINSYAESVQKRSP